MCNIIFSTPSGVDRKLKPKIKASEYFLVENKHYTKDINTDFQAKIDFKFSWALIHTVECLCVFFFSE